MLTIIEELLILFSQPILSVIILQYIICIIAALLYVVYYLLSRHRSFARKITANKLSFLSKNLAVGYDNDFGCCDFRIAWYSLAHVFLTRHVHTRDHVHYTTSNLARWHVAISSDKYSRAPSAHRVYTWP